MSVAIPSVGGSVSPGRFIATAIGAGAGIAMANQYLAPAVPAALVNWQIGPFTGQGMVLGAGALLGAALANIVYSKVSGS